MKLKGIVITLLASLSILSSCAEETCPVAMKPEYSFKKKVKSKFKARKKPTPSLIHITRVNYRPNSAR